MDRLATVIDGLGRVARAGLRSGGILEFHFVTNDPNALFERVRHSFPTGLDPKLVIACRPEAIARFRVLYPPGVTGWRPPS